MVYYMFLYKLYSYIYISYIICSSWIVILCPVFFVHQNVKTKTPFKNLKTKKTLKSKNFFPKSLGFQPRHLPSDDVAVRSNLARRGVQRCHADHQGSELRYVAVFQRTSPGTARRHRTLLLPQNALSQTHLAVPTVTPRRRQLHTYEYIHS